MNDAQKKTLTLRELKQKATDVLLNSTAAAKVKGGSDALTSPTSYSIIQDDLDII